MPDYRVDTTRPEYSWIPFFWELARRLHEDGWRNKQPLIVAELQLMKRQGLIINPWVDNLDYAIDPFSVFAMIRRVGWSNARKIMESYKAFFGIDVELPKEEPTNPTINAQNSLFFGGVPDTSTVDPHWDLFEYVMSTQYPQAEAEVDVNRLEELLNGSVAVNGAGVATVTGALYWVQPHRFLKEDTIDYYLDQGDYTSFGKSYIERLNRVRGHDGRPFPELNNEAWFVKNFKSDPATASLWMVTAGKGNRYAKEFLKGGFSAIGWGHEFDPADFSDAREMGEALKSVWPTSYDQIARFHKEIRRGDIIVMRTSELGELRYGFVGSDGTYSVDVSHMDDRRGVHWRPTGISPEGLALPRRNTVSRVREASESLLERIMEAEGMVVASSDRRVPVKQSQPEPVEWPSKEVFLDDEEQLRMLSLLRRKQNLILQGPPGTGKTFIARRLAYALMGEKDESRIASVQFHQSYSYEDFVGGLRPDVNADDQLVFNASDGAFLRLCERARDDESSRPYVMLIDEINRGNLSRVFGELMMLIEPDKREEDQAVDLPHRAAMVKAGDAESAKFHVPKNVYIIGTMNLADRSLTGMNVAMRRRFGFVDLRPQFGELRFDDWLAENGLPRDDEELSRLRNKIIERMTELNRSIQDDRSLGAQYAVGHSFFCPGEDDPVGGDWDAWYMAVIEHEIKPLLKEYWFDQPEKAEDAVKQLLND